MMTMMLQMKCQPPNKQLERTVIRRHVRGTPPLNCSVRRHS
jgi:hypothetical protein